MPTRVLKVYWGVQCLTKAETKQSLKLAMSREEKGTNASSRLDQKIVLLRERPTLRASHIVFLLSRAALLLLASTRFDRLSSTASRGEYRFAGHDLLKKQEFHDFLRRTLVFPDFPLFQIG